MPNFYFYLFTCFLVPYSSFLIHRSLFIVPYSSDSSDSFGLKFSFLGADGGSSRILGGEQSGVLGIASCLGLRTGLLALLSSCLGSRLGLSSRLGLGLSSSASNWRRGAGLEGLLLGLETGSL